MVADGLSARERKRRRGFTKNLAHQAAHFAAGYQIGSDLELLPRRGSGSLEFDLVNAKATSDGAPFHGQMLG